MDSIDTLMKLTRRNLDEKRRALVAMQDRKEEVERLVEALDKDIQKEGEFVSQAQDTSGFTFASFLKRVKRKRAEYITFIEELNGYIEHQQEEIRELFAELKRYELLKQKKILEQRKEQARKDTMALDELAMTRHQRRQNTVNHEG